MVNYVFLHLLVTYKVSVDFQVRIFSILTVSFLRIPLCLNFLGHKEFMQQLHILDKPQG